MRWRLANPLHVVWVSTKTGATIKGVLVDRTRELMVLRAASLGALDPQQGETWTKMQGDVVIPMDNVDYWQEGLEAGTLD